MSGPAESFPTRCRTWAATSGSTQGVPRHQLGVVGWAPSSSASSGRSRSYVGVPHAVATVNGTAALHVALLARRGAAGRRGPRCRRFTFIATAHAVAHCGAHPVFLDCEPVSWGLDPAKVADFLARECESRTACVVEPHDRAPRDARCCPCISTAIPATSTRCSSCAARWPIAIVEDATEVAGRAATGAAASAPTASSGCLSFNGNKIITTGGGGMVLTRDAALAARVRRLTTQARATRSSSSTTRSASTTG